MIRNYSHFLMLCPHDIIELNETNITLYEGYHINKQITSGRIIWSKGNPQKLKEKGVVIYMSNKWENI